MRVLFIADQLTNVPRTPGDKHPGGAELTDEAAIQASPYHVDTMLCEEFDAKKLDQYDVHILGNAEKAKPELFAALSLRGRHVLFEHDLRICNWRGNFPHTWDPAHRVLNKCLCPHRHLRDLFDTSLGAIFLTHRQLSHYERNPSFRSPASLVLGSSIFNQEFLERIERVEERPRQGTYFLKSRARIKGGKEAEAFALERGWAPIAIENLQPATVLDLLQSAERFVYLPLALEPAGRMVVEARFLGAETILNSHVGVSGESWWHLPKKPALTVLADAPMRFWRLVEQLINSTSTVRPPRPGALQRGSTIETQAPYMSS